MAAVEMNVISLQERAEGRPGSSRPASGAAASTDQFAPPNETQNESNNIQEFSLPPADRGRQAWLVLFGCFATEALLWGFIFSFGVFQDYYTNHEPFVNEASNVAIIGTCATGLSYIGALAAFPIYQRWPNLRLWSFYAGLVVLALSVFAASFATSVPHLILTQGILYGIGGTLLYNPTVVFLQEWFVQRKGFAFGIMWSGTGVGGVSIPFLISALLDRYGFRTTLRIWAVTIAVVALPLAFSVKPRLPTSGNVHPRRTDSRYVTSRTFWVLQLSNVIQGLGFFMPTIYLKSYISSLNMDPNLGTATLALVNGATTVACPLIGSLVDRMSVTDITAAISIVAAFSTFVLWGLGVSAPVLVIFSLVYGFSAGAYSTTYTGVVKAIQARDNGADPGMMLGYLAAGRGLGSVLSGPLSGALLNMGTFAGAHFGYGTQYGSLIVFTGTTAAAAGGFSWGARRVGWI